MKRFLPFLHLKKEFRGSAGWTLSETLCTLALVLFIITLSLPYVEWNKRMQVYRELQRLYAVIRYAQKKALIDGAPCILKFALDRMSYTLEYEYALDRNVIFGVQKGVYGPPSYPRTEITNSITWPSQEIIFYPPGEPSGVGSINAGAVYMTDKSHSCTYALTCDASYGSIIRCYRYTDTWELLS